MSIPRELILFGDAKFWRDVFAKAHGKTRSHYLAYLDSTAWRHKRNQAFDRDKGKCQHCKFAEADNVHHKTYARLGDENPDDLISLCRTCHKAEHGLAQEFMEAVLNARTY